MNEGQGSGDRTYLTLSGTAIVRPAFVARLGRAAWMARLVYNAAIDPRVPFWDGLPFRLTMSKAHRAGSDAFEAPVPSDRFLPVPREQALGKELTALFAEFPALREFPRSILDNAIGEACRARARHVADCVAAKAAGRKLPTLHFCSAADDWSITTDDFMLLRIGDDIAQRKPKTRHVMGTTIPNRRARAAKRVAREQEWAAEKRRCGWSGDEIAAGLARRAARRSWPATRVAGRASGRSAATRRRPRSASAA